MTATYRNGPQAWAAGVGYAQSVSTTDVVFVAGQYAADADGEVTGESFDAQARLTFTNLAQVLEDAGSGLDRLLHLRCYLLRKQDFDLYREVRREVLTPPFPASLVVVVADFTYAGMLIELEAVASRS